MSSELYSLLVLPSITISIPAYNEEDNIEWVVKDALANLPKYFKDYEVLIIDDGSIDKTGKIADRFSKRFKKVRVIHQPNGGYSKAMLTGIENAKKEFVAYMPADGQFLINDMRHCFEIMESYDLILGYRGGRPDYSTYRLVLSYGYLLILTLLFNIKYMDVGWVNIWKTEKVQGIKLDNPQGIFILTEVLVKFNKLGYKVTEAPSYYHPRLGGKVKNAKIKVVILTLLNAFTLWLKIKFIDKTSFKKN